MKISRLWTLLLVAMLANGCALFHHHRTKPVQPAPASAPTATLNPIVTPDNSLTAKVATYNSAGRFAVLSFPVGQMPNMDQTLFLYRNGLKVGEVKITGPQRDNDVVADLVSGTAQVGDEVRDQ
jgi:PBP1b-binding outer membrane lipoprotein LpoB